MDTVAGLESQSPPLAGGAIHRGFHVDQMLFHSACDEVLQLDARPGSRHLGALM